MKRNILYIALTSILVMCSACDPTFNDFTCKDGKVLLVPSDNHSGSEWMGTGNVICVHKLTEASSESYSKEASNGYYAAYASPLNVDLAYSYESNECLYFNNDESCHYKECPDCVVLYCNKDNKLTLSDISCYDYYIDRETQNQLLTNLDKQEN